MLSYTCVYFVISLPKFYANVSFESYFNYELKLVTISQGLGLDLHLWEFFLLNIQANIIPGAFLQDFAGPSH